jgi:hypothetical protein
MVDSNELQQLELQQTVERAVAQVLNRQLPKLQAELVQSVLAELPSVAPPAAGRESGAGSANTGHLVQAVASVHAGSTQKEILRALLDAGTAYAARVALFVVKAGNASGWQGRGFADDDAIKDFSLDMTAGPAAHAYQNRIATPANIAEMDRRFVAQFGGPENEQILVLPLVLKDKIAALLYADGGATGLVDAASLELLVVSTSTWLEVTSLRKQAHKDGPDSVSGIAAASFTAATGVPPLVPAEAESDAHPHVAPAPAPTVAAISDPFAAHAPKHVAPAAPEPDPVVEVVEVAGQAAAAGAAASAPAAATDPFSGMSPEDAETHRKAQRFARLLVDEIKLYNQAKVAEGRRNRDLYDRLKEDIEKSRSTYGKRYGTTVAMSGDYFQKEVIRNLAEEDTSLMGANFRK